MDIVILVLTILGLMTLSLIVTHLWIGFWDMIKAGLKKIFHIGKKQTTNWHTLDETTKNVKESDVKQSISQISENERLH